MSLLARPLAAHAQSGPITDLGTLGGTNSAAQGINGSGQVVGFSYLPDGTYHAFIWDSTNQMHDLGTLGGALSEANGINAGGEAAGWANLPSGVSHAVIWDSSGQIHDLGTLGGSESDAEGVNDSGEVVGYSQATDGSLHAVTWSSTGVIQDLGTLGGAASYGYGINCAGAVVGEVYQPIATYLAASWSSSGAGAMLSALGYNAFGSGINCLGEAVGAAYDNLGNLNAAEWSASGSISILGSFGGPSGAATAVNDSGEVVGYADQIDGTTHAAVWDSNGAITDVGTLGGPNSYATANNDSGAVVGYSDLSDGSSHAFLYVQQSPSTVAYLYSTPGTLGGPNSIAYGVNNLGQLVGQSDTDASGDTAGFYWDLTSGLVNLTSLTNSGEAFAINPNGQIAGWGQASSSSDEGLYFSSRSGSPTYLGALDVQSSSQALAINGSGTVAGYSEDGSSSAVYWDNLQQIHDVGPGFGTGINSSGQMSITAGASGQPTAELFDPGQGGSITSLGGLPGATYSQAMGLNDAQQVVGFSILSQGDEAFLWSASTGMTDLGNLGQSSQALAVNGSGQVVGTSADASGAASAYLWDSVNGIRDLNSMALIPPGWRLETAYSISDTGYIAGAAVNTVGDHEAFLLSPVPSLASLVISPTTVAGGASATATLTLSQPAPAGGIVISLFTSDPSAYVPEAIAIPAGQSSVAIGVGTTGVSSDTLVTVTAKYNNGSVNASLTVLACIPVSITLNPAVVTGGATSTAIVTLNRAAAAGGLTLNLISSNVMVATVPVSITVPAGSISASFPVSTVPINIRQGFSTHSYIYATANNTSVEAFLTIDPPVPANLSIAPSSVSGGSNATGLVTLTGPAHSSLKVTLSSSNTAAVPTPLPVWVQAGKSSASITVKTQPVDATVVVNLIATANGVNSPSASITVRAAGVLSVSLNPSSVVGGSPSTG
ncbi:MAG TPA: hypothetical protein VGS41_04335, partial [Chthonomonadales bacterium]|nr:hypothetical protein [Chthonomonadales bacterium]